MEDPELGDACLAASKVNDFWKLFEEAEKLVEERGEKQSQQWLLETIAAICYASISLDYTRKLHEGAKKSIERYRDDELRRQRGQDLIDAYANVLKPDQAFQLFHEAYRDLAEMYEDKELQEACLAFSEVNDVWKLYEEAKKLAEKYRDKQLQRQFLNVIAAFCGESIIYYSKTGKIDKAQVLYDDLKQLVETHGERQPELWVRQAKGAVNLIYTYVTANKPDEAQTVYGELRKLAEDHPDEPKLRVWQANRASDVIYAYATAEKLDEAQVVYGELRKLAEDDPDESRLRVWQAKGAFDLTYVYAKAGKCDEAREMFQELEELVSDKDVGEEMMLYRKQKIDEVPMMDWLRQLLKERCV
jgi:tetratricopeptide (TPR) repeat protein